MNILNFGNRLAKLCLLACNLGAAAALAQAPSAAPGPATSAGQAWPSQPIKILVPIPAGGASDQIGRLIGKAISYELKVPVVVAQLLRAKSVWEALW